MIGAGVRFTRARTALPGHVIRIAVRVGLKVTANGGVGRRLAERSGLKVTAGAERTTDREIICGVICFSCVGGFTIRLIVVGGGGIRIEGTGGRTIGAALGIAARQYITRFGDRVAAGLIHATDIRVHSAIGATIRFIVGFGVGRCGEATGGIAVGC